MGDGRSAGLLGRRGPPGAADSPGFRRCALPTRPEGRGLGGTCQRGGCHPAPGPWLIATGMTTRDNTETANFLACSAPRLAAGRATGYGRAQTKVMGAFANNLEFIDLIRIENLLLELAATAPVDHDTVARAGEPSEPGGEDQHAAAS